MPAGGKETIKPGICIYNSAIFVDWPVVVAGYGPPTTWGPDSRGAVVAEGAGGFVAAGSVEETPGITLFAFSICGCAAAEAWST